MNRKMILWLVLGVVLVIVIVAALLIWWNFRAHRVEVPPFTPTITTTTGAPPATTPPTVTIPPVVSLATGLQVPWSLAFLPDGSIILTERPGRIRLVDPRQGLLAEPLMTVPDVAATGEGGLLGIALHPGFAANGFVYVYHTYQDGGGLANRVVRFVLRGRSLTGGQVIIDGIPGAGNHDGGRLKFGPDGLLYITTGDATNADAAQDLEYLGGKILRLRDDGSIPADNPFPGSPVYTYGHRNPEGLAWDDRGRLWATEHGSSATDELNLIAAGKNYGWPVIRGDETAAGMVTPIINSGSDTWAPSGTAYRDGSILFAGLRGQGLFEVDISGTDYTLTRHLGGEFGRLRDVVVGPDGYLYLLTSNRDGRGLPTPEDDQLIRLDPAAALR
jgi:glucose/arabinose dehydrogenase